TRHVDSLGSTGTTVSGSAQANGLTKSVAPRWMPIRTPVATGQVYRNRPAVTVITIGPPPAPASTRCRRASRRRAQLPPVRDELAKVDHAVRDVEHGLDEQLALHDLDAVVQLPLAVAGQHGHAALRDDRSAVH